MSRHGLYEAEFDDVNDVLSYGRWRGAVASAIRGRKGQALLRELLAALDSIESERLIGEALENSNGEVCALGALGRARGLDLHEIDYEDPESVADFFGINEKLAQEIMWVNDEHLHGNDVRRMKERFQEVRQWVLRHIESRGQLVLRSPDRETDEHG